MRGILHTLEAAVAVIILLSIVIFVTQTQQEVDLTRIGYNCLKHLDNKGILRNSEIDTIFFNAELQQCLPELVNFEIKVCRTSNCPASNIPEKSIFLSSYLIAGDEEFNPRLINLWLWSQ